MSGSTSSRKWSKAGGHKSYREFNVNGLAMASRNVWPEIKSKAHEASLVCKFLCELVHVNRHPGDAMLLQCLQGHSSIYGIMSGAGRRFTPKQAQSFTTSRVCFCLRAWAQHAVENVDHNRYEMKPKHHLPEHRLNYACEKLRKLAAIGFTVMSRSWEPRLE